MTAVNSAAAGAMAASDRSGEIAMVARTYDDSQFTKATASPSVTLTLQSDGDLVVTFNGGGSGTPNSDEWHISNVLAGLGDDWEVRAVVNSGTLTTGSTAWQRINVNRSWSKSVVSQAPPFSASVNLDFEFRLFGSIGSALVTVSGVVLSISVTQL